jgi:hypothetical protein
MSRARRALSLLRFEDALNVWISSVASLSAIEMRWVLVIVSGSHFEGLPALRSDKEPKAESPAVVGGVLWVITLLQRFMSRQ